MNHANNYHTTAIDRTVRRHVVRVLVDGDGAQISVCLICAKQPRYAALRIVDTYTSAAPCAECGLP